MKKLIFAVFFFFVEFVAIAQSSNYILTDLGTLGGYETHAYGINNSGQIVGYSYVNDNSAAHAFLYSNGTIQDLGTLDSRTNSAAFGINDSGQIVGFSYSNGSYMAHAFTYSNGTMQDIGTLGGDFSFASEINNAGQIVGHSRDGSGAIRAFLYNNGAMQNLGTLGGSESHAWGINDLGQVVGDSSRSDNTYHAFLYGNGSMQDLGTTKGMLNSQAWGINNSGQVVGYSHQHSGAWEDTPYYSFLYSNGIYQDMGSLGGPHACVVRINNSGYAVGSSDIYNNLFWRAFLFDGNLMVDLNTVTIGMDDWMYLEKATDINDNGQIVGFGYKKDGLSHAFLLTPVSDPVPEPATMLLLGSGLIGLAGARRRYRK